MHPSETTTRRLLPQSEVQRRLWLSRTTVRKLVLSGELPAPARLGNKNVWLENEIEDFIDRTSDNRVHVAPS